ncbi:MAG: choline dehydrogenase [Gaiellales bacterium]|nr:choline dehydrogenase [Gaiellales bacterium]
MIDPFAVDLPVRITFAEGAIDELPSVVGGRRALVIVEGPVASNPSVVKAIRGFEVREKPPGEPTFSAVAQAAADLDASSPDVLVAIGGGSAIDLAKAARLVAGHGDSLARFVAGGLSIGPPSIDLVAVPTTSGTGSEVSGGAVVVDPVEGRKLGVAHPLMRAQAALVDPLLTLELPSDMTAYTGIDALAQALGGVIVTNANPLSVAIGLESCRKIAAGLETAVRDGGNRTARADTSLGSLLAGMSMNLSDTGADHALGHSLGSTYGLPHGLTVGLMLAEALDVSRAVCAPQLERVADALGEPDDGTWDGSRAVRAVRSLLRRVGFPTLRDVGVGEERLDRLVELTLADYCLSVDPKRWDEADVRAAYGAALALGAR